MAKEVPKLVLLYLTRDFPAADLLVQCVEQLLPRRRAGKCRPLEERAAEPPLVAKTLWRAIERNAQPIHEIDDLGAPFGHFLDRRLMLQKISAVDRVIKVQPFVVALLPRDLLTLLIPPWRKRYAIA